LKCSFQLVLVASTFQPLSFQAQQTAVPRLAAVQDRPIAFAKSLLQAFRPAGASSCSSGSVVETPLIGCDAIQIRFLEELSSLKLQKRRDLEKDKQRFFCN